MADAELGPLLRLAGLAVSQLPAADAGVDDLAPFLLALLQEAVAFVDTIDDRSPSTALWQARGSKVYSGRETGAASGGSSLRVELVERVAHPREGTTERWVGRRSTHRDAATAGTATWREFRAYMKDAHAATEAAMTPAVVAAHRDARVWAVPADWRADNEGGRQWGAVSLAVHEMRHKIGRPLLRDRVFPVLQMTAAATGSVSSDDDEPLIPEVLIVSVPLRDWAAATTAAADSVLSRAKDVVVGAYVSVERIRALPATDDGDDASSGPRDIEWIMATASDARGALPPWLQAPAVPAAIAKDVPLFLKWIAAERRKRDAGPAAPPPAAAPPVASPEIPAPSGNGTAPTPDATRP